MITVSESRLTPMVTGQAFDMVNKVRKPAPPTIGQTLRRRAGILGDASVRNRKIEAFPKVGWRGLAADPAATAVGAA